MLLLGQFSCLVIEVHIIPAIGTERIDDQRRAEKKADLRTIQPRLQAGDVFLIERITLLHIDVMGTDVKAGTARKQA